MLVKGLITNLNIFHDESLDFLTLKTTGVEPPIFIKANWTASSHWLSPGGIRMHSVKGLEVTSQ